MRLEELFRSIRDVPYSQNFIEGTEGLSCKDKHTNMVDGLYKLGISSRFVTTRFAWHELSKRGVQYPPLMSELAYGAGESFHMACEAYLDDGWTLLDATWDKHLADVGFPVNEDPRNCVHAVFPRDIIIHKDLDIRDNLLDKFRANYSNLQWERKRIFYKELDSWMNKIRNRHQ
ncbi:hypothetical protein GOV11_02115 [Candidatus Woesearchaeota archaeon]|nr:hypothetical protein [Candidatus Woesearchaeota archaeon]